MRKILCAAQFAFRGLVSRPLIACLILVGLASVFFGFHAAWSAVRTDNDGRTLNAALTSYSVIFEADTAPARDETLRALDALNALEGQDGVCVVAIAPIAAEKVDAHAEYDHYVDADVQPMFDYDWVCGYAGEYRPNRWFAESEGFFFTKEEMRSDARLIYTDSRGWRPKALKDVREVGSGGLVASIFLEGLSAEDRLEKTYNLCLLPCGLFFAEGYAPRMLRYRFFNGVPEGADKQIRQILAEAFPDGRVVKPMSERGYFAPYNFPKLFILLVLCLIGVSNFTFLFSYLLDRMKRDFSLYAVNGATGGTLLWIIAFMWLLLLAAGLLIAAGVNAALSGPLRALLAYKPLTLAQALPMAAFACLLPPLLCAGSIARCVRLSSLFRERL